MQSDLNVSLDVFCVGGVCCFKQELKSEHDKKNGLSLPKDRNVVEVGGAKYG